MFCKNGDEMRIQKMLDIIPPKIIGGEAYVWEIFGTNARYLDFEKNVTIVFDEKTGAIYLAMIGNDYDIGHDVLWVNKRYYNDYIKAIASRSGMEVEEILKERYTIIESLDKMIELIKKEYYDYLG